MERQVEFRNFGRRNVWNSSNQRFEEKSFHPFVRTDYFDSVLEVPNGRNPDQNAWLTITLNYSLDFADSRNPVPGVIFNKAGKSHAKDSDGNYLPVKDWSTRSKATFNKRFLESEKIWNHKFLLRTPSDCDLLDYDSMSGPGWIVRPNILCLFRLVQGPKRRTVVSSLGRLGRHKFTFKGKQNAHRKITVVRMADSTRAKFFRSHATLLKARDVATNTIGHELGHALDQMHIRALRGDKKCLVAAFQHQSRCYTSKVPGDSKNIMGGGNKLTKINAISWLESIEAHTGIAKSNWKVSMNTRTATRKIPFGVGAMAKPKYF